MSSLVFGMGVNDVDYQISRYETINGKSVKIWICPFYRKWQDMLRRCYSKTSLRLNPSYEGCSVDSEWLLFEQFKFWMESKEWQGLILDKDLLVKGNRVYSKDTCCFISEEVNLFISDKYRPDGMTGVYLVKSSGRFRSQCWSVATGKQEYLGTFNTAEEAHLTWRLFKCEQAVILASKQNDPIVANAIINRYSNEVIK